MSVIQRPSKQGGATTYQGKVAAGYTKILASEVDADLDTIYSAWNTGVDTVNIRDGSITGAKLAPGAVGTRELADSGVATVDLADAAVTTPKLADLAVTTGKLADGAVTDVKMTAVSWSKISGGAVQSGIVPLLPRGFVVAGGTSVDIYGNLPGTPSFDNTKPSYILRVDYTADELALYRAPPPGTAFVKLFSVSGTGALPPLSVDRGEIAVNAIIGGSAFLACPASFSLSTPVGTWVNYASLPSLTTRGGWVMLKAQYNLSAIGAVSGAQTIAARWLRNGSPVSERAWLLSSATAAPLPALELMDNPPQGTYTYSMQLLISANCAIVSSGTGQGFLEAIEIG